jgi:hypothetical protein
MAALERVVVSGGPPRCPQANAEYAGRSLRSGRPPLSIATHYDGPLPTPWRQEGQPCKDPLRYSRPGTYASTPLAENAAPLVDPGLLGAGTYKKRGFGKFGE